MVSTLTKMMEKITWKHWLLFLLLSQSVYLAMVTQTIPRISHEAGGMKLFDMLPFGYSIDYAETFLVNLTEKGYWFYTFVQLPLDLLFPILNFLAGLCLFLLIFRIYRKFVPLKKFQISPLWVAAILLSLGMIFDYLENILIFTMLTLKEGIPSSVVSTSSLFTIIKSMSTMIFYLICSLFVIFIIVKWIQQKYRGRSMHGER